MCKTAACSEEKQFLCPEMKIWGTSSKCTRCMGRGLGRGFTPAHIHSQLGSCSDRMAQAAGGTGWRKGSGGWSFLTLAKWLRQTQIWHSHELLCSVNATSSSCPGPQPCCTTLWNEECFKGSCTHKDLLQEQIYAGSHPKNIGVSICRNENWWKLGHFCLMFPVQPWQLNQ